MEGLGCLRHGALYMRFRTGYYAMKQLSTVSHFIYDFGHFKLFRDRGKQNKAKPDKTTKKVRKPCTSTKTKQRSNMIEDLI